LALLKAAFLEQHLMQTPSHGAVLPDGQEAAPVAGRAARNGRSRRQTSLRAYLAFVILLPTIPLAVLSCLLIASEASNTRQQLQASLVKLADTQAVVVDRELTATIDSLTVLSYSHLLAEGELERFYRHLKALPKLRPSWSSLYLIDKNGKTLFTTSQDFGSMNENVAGTPDFRRALAAKSPSVRSLQPGPPQGDPATAIQIPVYIHGELRYFLGAWIPSTSWQRLLVGTGTPEGGFVAIFDANRRIIARSPHGERFIGSSVPASGQRAMAANQHSGLSKADRLEGGQIYVAWKRTEIGDWGVSVGMPAGPVDAALRQGVLTAGLGGVLSLVVGAALAWVVSRRVTVPLRELATYGVRGANESIAIREIAQLRDSLASLESQRQQAIDRLQSTADELQALFNSSPIGMAIAQDSACAMVRTNPALKAMLRSAEGASWPLAKVRHEGQELNEQDLPLQRAALTGVVIENIELEVAQPDGAVLKLLAHAVPLRDARGRLRGAVAGYVDVTQRAEAESRFVLAERRLRESRQMVELAQQAGEVGFFDYRFADDTVTWTTGLSKLLGEPLSAFEGSWADWLGHVEPADAVQVQERIDEAICSQTPDIRFEFRTLHANNTIRWLSSRCVLMYNEAGAPAHLIGVVLDVTDQKQAERERVEFLKRQQEARLEAEKANKAKDEFLAMLGHELRNPLGAISSAAEVLNRAPTEDLAEKARSIIVRQTRHLARLMEDLLDVTRVIAGKILLARTPTNLAVLVQRVLSTLEVARKLVDHQVELDLQETWVMADPTRAEQVINNLLTNALKYTPAGGTIWVRLSGDDKWCVLTVSDNGMGMTTALVAIVFDLFVQGDRSLDRRQGGLGIGLTLVRRLIELHGGHVSASSPGPNQGSTFTVRLPRCAPPFNTETSGTEISLEKKSVVIVEDNADACEALRAMLEMDGHLVRTAEDGVSGLNMILNLAPDVALVDIGLPGLNGLEIASRVRAAGLTLRMVALSGYGQATDVKDALAAGFDGHLVKPVDPRQLARFFVETTADELCKK
jgi:PAS domain S-box-containing protein